jgi:hypothetical protein
MEEMYRFRQIRIDKMLFLRIKGYCVQHEKKISTFLEGVLEWFLRRASSGHTIIYQASRKGDHLMTIRISLKLAETIRTLAAKERISDARVIFTALTLYLKEHRLQ